jgi:hypothetical protein
MRLIGTSARLSECKRPSDWRAIFVSSVLGIIVELLAIDRGEPLYLPPLPPARRVNRASRSAFGGKSEVFAQFLRHFAFGEPRRRSASSNCDEPSTGVLV